nr:hypothetical protein [Tanacetum cinerariifolium]
MTLDALYVDGHKEIAFRNFIYTEDDEDLSFLPKEPSSGLRTGSLFVSVNAKPLKANKVLVIQPAEVMADSGESLKLKLFVVHPSSVAARIKDMKCKTRGGSSRPLVKRKLSPRSLNSHATRAKTSSSKEGVLFLKVSVDDEEFLDLHDRCYVRQAIVDNAVNRRSRELLQVIKKLRGEFDVMRSRERARENEREGLRKWACYQQSLLTLESKVTSLKVEKIRLEAVKVSIQKEVEELKLDMRELVSSAIVYGRCRDFEQVADIKEPFDMSKVKGYLSSYKKDHTQASNDLAISTFPWLDEFVADPSAPIKALLSKNLPTLQRPAPLRTQVPLPSSQRATLSSVPVSNLMSPPADASIMKPQSSYLH